MNWLGINVKNTFNNYELTSPFSNGAVILKQYRSNISQSTGVFHLIFKHREEIYQTREGVFHLISKHWEVTYQTREGVFHLISKHREVMHQTRGVRHQKSRHREKIYIKNKECLISSQNTENETREGVIFMRCRNWQVGQPRGILISDETLFSLLVMWLFKSTRIPEETLSKNWQNFMLT